MAFLCRIVTFLSQSFAENTEQIGTCVKTGETCLCFENCINGLEN